MKWLRGTSPEFKFLPAVAPLPALIHRRCADVQLYNCEERTFCTHLYITLCIHSCSPILFVLFISEFVVSVPLSFEHFKATGTNHKCRYTYIENTSMPSYTICRLTLSQTNLEMIESYLLFAYKFAASGVSIWGPIGHSI